jgi:MoaA/NifB/PqqE/SkfB family radical SAM enzyme
MRMSSLKALSLLRRSFTPNRPYHTQWLLTRRCNYRCRSCGVWRESNGGEELSFDEIRRGLDVLRRLGVIELVLSGGNPLLRDDIDKIIDYASRFFITTVYDNGSMVVEKIDALRRADFVAISLDTLDEKKFDYIKGVPGAWKRAIEGIETLQKEGVSVVISPTISQLNLYEIVDLTRYFITRGIPVLYCLYSYDFHSENRLFGIGRKSDGFEITDRQAMVEVCDRLMELKERHKGLFITEKTLKALRQFFLNGQRTWRCQALKGFFIIDHLGRVAGCHLRQPVASVYKLPRLWNSEKFEELRRVYRECSRCTYLCYIFYSIHGDLLNNLGIIWDQWKNVRLLHSKSTPFGDS